MPYTAKNVIRAFERGGWVKTRQSGSHVRLYNAQRPANSVSISVHQGKEIPPGTLRAIIRTAGMTLAEFEELLKS
ncbi:MAG: type II toxin-antitoxin system HicA family toxin [Armatimonadota bacterium]